MCGYPVAALLGTNLRILQGTDRDQDGRVRLAEAIQKGSPARVLVRNYRPDGSLFWNECVMQPVRSGKGELTHFIGYHRDASERLKGAERSPLGTAVLAARGPAHGLAFARVFRGAAAA